MAEMLSLTRPRPSRAPVSLVPMIDVLLIMLVFFMVTSTYLDLDMIPAVDSAEGAAPGPAAAADGTVLIRLGADGRPAIQGRSLLHGELAAHLAARPDAQVIVLPTGAATMQALVSVMDTVTGAGVTRMRVVRLEARP
ncbi:biopolymer transport protein ExbD [Cribrihabitans marinus]|uniref:Biopolymer transport protein ExbD n=1 Tax=Cribrihabitans marinus TaxID=1227549 RepID=A0A1H7DNT0_9RHOB|nr:biopolymer transporter ExbD [Cribrihabitans marinus]SEK03461.1 biopolymer transport protein ExbD [Cribrihabitans marinus]